MSPNALILSGVCGLLAGTTASAQQGLPLRGAEAEAFLRNAEVQEMEDFGVGVTRPQRVVVSDGIHRFHAS